ncbi:MAG: transcription antitermination factor NusB [bacterium]|nr:transcription antitermination factor NusB [bacterium]
MGIRHLARQRAMQLLYALEYGSPGGSFEEVERLYLAGAPDRRRGWGPFARRLAAEVHKRRDELDRAIEPALEHWTLDRLPRIDRICLRMALCELAYFPDIPLRVTINEYIELVRLFSTDDSPQYINAVLDRIARDYSHKDVQLKEPAGKPLAGAESRVEAESPPREEPPREAGADEVEND